MLYRLSDKTLNLSHAGQRGGKVCVITVGRSTLTFDFNEISGLSKLFCPVLGVLTRRMPGPFLGDGPGSSVAIGSNDAKHGSANRGGQPGLLLRSGGVLAFLPQHVTPTTGAVEEATEDEEQV